jgi:hypothetical protein
MLALDAAVVMRPSGLTFSVWFLGIFSPLFSTGFFILQKPRSRLSLKPIHKKTRSRRVWHALEKHPQTKKQ